MGENDNKKKDCILVVLPYGMCFRQVVLNENLWGYLRKNYEIDLLTPLKLKNKDVVGVRNIFPCRSRNKILGLIQSFNHRLINSWKCFNFMHFLLNADLGENLSLRYRWFPADGKGVFFFGYLRHTRWAGLIKKLFKKLPVLYPTTSYFRKNSYKFVIVTHVLENECIVTSLIANKLKVPVITITLGMDNYRNGLLFYIPDLMLLWGREHLYAFNNFQLPLNKELKKSKHELIGNLIHDNYLKMSEKCTKESFLRMYGLAEDEEVILIPTMTEEYLPNQTALCEIVIDFIRKYNLKVKIIVRTLPGVDVDMWEEFERKYPEFVILQIPTSASYDKRGAVNNVDLDQENKDIEIFVNTIKNSALLVNVYPTTLLVDALLFNTPSVWAMFDWNNASDIGTHPHQKPCIAKAITHPHLKHYNAVSTKDALCEVLYKFFILKQRNNLVSNELYDTVCEFSKDGRSGELAAAHIKDFINDI